MIRNLLIKGLNFLVLFLLVGVSIVPITTESLIKSEDFEVIKTNKQNEDISTFFNPDLVKTISNKENLHLNKDRYGVLYRKNTADTKHVSYDRSPFISVKNTKNQDELKNIDTKKETKFLELFKNTKTSYPKKTGNIFYVGGSGPNNYTSIQEAINSASNRDTVFVYDDSSPYFENLIIDKSINLIGEDKETTIIDGTNLNVLLDTVNITVDHVFINGFSINNNDGYYYQAAVLINEDYTTVSNCKIYENDWIGISFLDSSYSQISNCEFFENSMSIHMVDSNENIIRDCLFYQNTEDILLFSTSHNNQIINCTCIGNSYNGIHVQYSSGNQILNCTIKDGYQGIGMAYAQNTKMKGNIIINNYENFGIGSSEITDFYCDIDTSNTINGKPIYYWIDRHDEEVPSDAAFIGLVSCTNISVKDLEIKNNFQGFVGADISNCTIENSNFLNNDGHGIFLVSSKDNTIKNCACRNSFFSGIYLASQSNRNSIYNNTFSNIQVSCIWIVMSSDNNIENHKINSHIGISLEESGDNTLRNNTMVNCGLEVDGTKLSDYINDVDTSNSVNGKKLYYYINENGKTVPNDAGQVILVNCTYCNISNLDLSDGTIGLELAYSSYNEIFGNIINGNNLVAIDLDFSNNNYNKIKGNTILNNNYGIDVDISHNNDISNNILHNNGVAFSLDNSNKNLIKENDILDSWNGIYLSESDTNEIINNDIKKCGFNAIYLLYSQGNVLKENKMINCGFLVYGISLCEYINDVDTSNSVNGKKLYYYINENGKTVPNDAGEVILVDCNNCNVTNLDLSDGTIGVELAYSNNNFISKNNLNNNKFAGIYLESSEENIVKSNTMKNNSYGVDLQLANRNEIRRNIIRSNNYGCYLYLSNSNTISGNNLLYNSFGIRADFPSDSNNIYHNNLIGNGFNAWDENKGSNSWDDGKKGNYWADYKEKYPNAKRLWLKGIWNTPYEIPQGDNFDRYPLISLCINSKSKTEKPTYFYLLERILERFPILKQILC